MWLGLFPAERRPEPDDLTDLKTAAQKTAPESGITGDPAIGAWFESAIL
jgi:hypothetical protein